MPLKIPTDLDQDLVQEFQLLVRKHYQKNIDDEEAKKEALRLVTAYALLINASPEYHYGPQDQMPLEKSDYYTTHDLKNYLRLTEEEIKELIILMTLKPKNILNENNELLITYFLMREHRHVLPLKSLLRRAEVLDANKKPTGEILNWDEFQSPKDVIEGYGIYEHISFYKGYVPRYGVGGDGRLT